MAYPLWVPVHKTWIVHLTNHDGSVTVTVPGWPSFRVDPDTKVVSVLVRNEDEEKLATSPAVARPEPATIPPKK